ncbi:NUDIX hydrolase domain-like protein [Cubamyces lactineus]|nr:NUDIX hydrolase domain-like protein [Cubamyces lactineus]
MGEAYVNFLSGSPLNRLSWLRTSQPFLNAIAHAPSTRWLVFKEGQPLLHTQPSASKQSLARLTTSDVKPLLGPEPFFAQGQQEGELAQPDVPVLEAARLRGPPIVFLGLHETDADSSNALPSSEFSAKTSAETVITNIKGTPYFSLDVSDITSAEVDKVLQAAATRGGGEFQFSEPRAALALFDAFDAALSAEARSMVDWNARNKYCPSCGSPVHSLWAGWKLTCSSLLPWADNTGRKPCPTAHGLHNFAHPRTDAVVIMAVIDETGDKILLGRNKKWPGKFYSCMAGFIEPGESFEDAVKRELWEEAGVKVWNVRYHSSQPWPYPANLMVGFYAIANSSQPLRTDLDNELEDARWYTRQEILQVLAHRDGTTLTRRDQRELAAAAEKSNPNQQQQQQPTPSSTANALAGDAVKAGEKEAANAVQEPPSAPPFKMPPLTAIAGVLIAEWAHGRAGFQPDAPKRGNL